MIDLETLSKEEHYEVPEGYFEELPKQVLNSIHKAKTRRRNIWLTSIAAVMAIVICSVTITHYMVMNERADQKLQAQKAIQYEEQIEDQMADYYSDELAQIDYLNY
ncbi:MAG: hypothetical protein K5636_06645 [Bacteroidales bacterium]|nr:hypothetical protein [Bacteroidales bacterium]